MYKYTLNVTKAKDELGNKIEVKSLSMEGTLSSLSKALQRSSFNKLQFSNPAHLFAGHPFQFSITVLATA